MPWTQQWLIPGHLVFVRFSGVLTAEDMGTSFTRSVELVNESTSSHRVHFLHDWTALEHFPRDLHKIQSALTARVNNRRKLGHVVMYGHKNPLLRFLSEVVFRFFKIPFLIFENADDAIRYLKQVDSNLPDITLPQDSH